MTKPALSPEQKKVLRGKHPLYSKLSGDVVWCIFEELGYSAEACERAMDDFFAAMQQTLLVMQHMEVGEASAFVLHAAPVPTVPPAQASAAPQLATTDSGEPALSAVMGASPCPLCAPLVGLSVSNANPAWPQYLPPFAVGCLCQCMVSANRALAAAPVAELPPPPNCGLVCPLLEGQLTGE